MPGGPPAPAASVLSCRNVPFRNGAGSNSHVLQLASAPLSSRGARRLGAGEKSSAQRGHACNPTRLAVVGCSGAKLAVLASAS